MSTSSSTLWCTTELHADPLLTDDTLGRFTGCKHKRFTLYGEDLLHFIRASEGIYLENLVNLVNFRFSREERFLGEELAKYAAH